MSFADFFNKLPIIAQVTKDNVSKAFDQLKREESNYFYKENLNQKLIFQNLESTYPSDILQGLKKILALLLLDKPVQQFTTKIILLLPNEEPEIKRLLYILLSEIASQTSYKDSLLLSIQPLYKQMIGNKSVVRGDSLKALSHLDIPEISTLLFAGFNKIMADKSAYVRKISSNSLYKLALMQEDEEDKETCKQNLQFLFKDTPFVIGNVLRVYDQVYLLYNITYEQKLNQDEKMEYIHLIYPKIVKELFKFSSFDQTIVLQILQRYSAIYFSHITQNPKSAVIFSSKQIKLLGQIRLEFSIDLIRKIIVQFTPKCCFRILQNYFLIRLLRYKNLIFQLKKKCTRAILRFINISSESKIIVLQMLDYIAENYPEFLQNQYKAFFITQLEKEFCKLKKLRILEKIVDKYNLTEILQELQYYTRNHQDEIKIRSVRALCIFILRKKLILANIALQKPQYQSKCLRILMNLLKTSSKILNDEIINSLTNLMKQNLKNNIVPLTFCLKYLNDLQNANAKSKLLSLLMQFCDKIPTLAAEYLRNLVKDFRNQYAEVKIMILAFSLQLLYVFPLDDQNLSKIVNIFKYILTMCSYDNNFVLRDRSRLIKTIIFKQIANKDILEAQRDDIIQKIAEFKEKNQNLQNFFSDHSFQLENNQQIQDDDQCSLNEIGSLSNLVQYELKNNKNNVTTQICQESTYKLRHPDSDQQPPNQVLEKNLVEEKVVPKVVKKEEETIQKTQKPIILESENQIQGLNQVLDDFFDD